MPTSLGRDGHLRRRLRVWQDSAARKAGRGTGVARWTRTDELWASTTAPRAMIQPAGRAIPSWLQSCARYGAFVYTWRSASTMFMRPARRAGHQADSVATAVSATAVLRTSRGSPARRITSGIGFAQPGGVHVRPA